MTASVPRQDDPDEAPPQPQPRPHRWVVIAVVLLFVSAGAVGVLLFVQPQSCGTCSGCGSTSNGPTPIGGAPPLSMGAPTPGGGANNRSYEMAVNPGSGLRWGNLTFEVQTSDGVAVSPQPDWSVLAKGGSQGSSSSLGTYDFSSSQWTSGGSILMISGQALVLELGTTDLAGAGDRLVVTYSLACLGPGTVYASLP
jgi:hypothetical protein